jgi:hypothetical protein
MNIFFRIMESLLDLVGHLAQLCGHLIILWPNYKVYMCTLIR